MTTPPRNLSSLGHGLPEDIVDEILDQLSGEDASLLKYALISRLWLHKTTARFFGSFTVRSRRNVGRLFELQNLLTSSERLPAHIHTLFVEVTPINAATAATLPHHLPWLQSFTLKGLAIDWDFEPSFLPSTGQHLETLTLCILPLSFISCVTRQFASVDTLRVYFATHAGEALAPRGERVGVKRLVVEAVPGHALPVIAALFEPEKLSSIQLDLDGTWSPVSPDDISTFFEVAGGHITELDCTLSGGGWTMPSKLIHGLRACARLRTAIISTPRTQLFSVPLWEGTIALLASLPLGVQNVRFQTYSRILLNRPENLQTFLGTVDWHKVEIALEHCVELISLKIAVFGFEYQPVSFIGRCSCETYVREQLRGRVLQSASFV
ncbi:hypothetical protein PsYK624_115290 [Phanerochaete sordida]|uniref:F-box domain-containing protein n=1 Tax=Phanerochaete sordida TaxID=48140 RepID=A0A9P3GHW3_9APHY|nr:hypothetical protein PsYK624_115290 [Phanerochaete sordida]